MSKQPEKPTSKPLRWVGSSKADLSGFPDEVRKAMGYALHLAQIGLKSPHAKPLSGFVGASVLEVVEDHGGETYRAVYTVKFREMVFVLHAFPKKSKSGIKTPKPDIDLIRNRLKRAAEDYKEHAETKKP